MAELGRSRVEERAAAWTPPPGRRRWPRAEGRAMVAALQASGDSVVAFAQRHGLHEERVRRWVRRLGGPRSAAAAVAAPPGFAPVRLVAPPAGGLGLEVAVGGAVVRVQRGFDAALLRAVVGALAGAPC